VTATADGTVQSVVPRTTVLTYAPFAASDVLVSVAKGGRILRENSTGPAVALVQGALVDLGYKMPRSIRAKAAPDGIFGFETGTVLKSFQSKNGLDPDGKVGKTTIAALDKMMASGAAPAPHSSPPPAPAPRTDHYQLGTADPTLKADPGAGIWNSQPKTATYAALKVSILNILPEAAVIIGSDAARHMLHYMGSTGSPLLIDLEGMISDVPSARQALEAEAAQAQEFVELLPVGTYSITSRMAESSYNTKNESWNWYFAIGGYSSWGKGKATVSSGAKGREYVLEFEYKFFDRYNWDKGKSVKILGIKVTDEFMAEFHRQGMAQEFDCHGTVKRRLTWHHGDEIPTEQFARSSGQR
jgi:peptidoglycan hydrolase-like protein with peptidoglycan-binding domain